MAAVEEAVALGAEAIGHLQARADIVRRAAHLGVDPVLADQALAHLDIGLEAAAGEHDGLRPRSSSRRRRSLS